MYWRPLLQQDLDACLAIEPACIGDTLMGRERALQVWRHLPASPAFQGSVYATERAGGGETIVGCGMGVFVSAKFVDRELAEPQPGLNSRIIASIANGERVLLDRDALARGNAGAGLDFVNLYGNWRRDLLDEAQQIEVQTLLGASFLDSLAGFRFNRIVKEAIGQPVIELARATGSYRMLAEFAATGSALFAAFPDSARNSPFSVAARMYRFQPPMLRFSPAEQSLLTAALDGKTDAELSRELGISIEAVKKRWLSVFGRVEVFRPELLAAPDVDRTSRGPQKRHRVLAYVRTHPEELRPYAWKPDA